MTHLLRLLRQLLGAGAAVFVAAAPLGPAAAAGFYDSFIFGERGPPCYARAYDTAHLQANPAQRLTGFALRLTQFAPPPPPGAEAFEVTFAYTLKGSDDRYQAQAQCSAAPVGAHCVVEGDGGDFLLSGDERGLLLRVGDRLQVEGFRSFSPDLARDGDDTLVRLVPLGPALCRFE